MDQSPRPVSLRGAPTAMQLASEVQCPIERVRVIGSLARQCGTLPRSLAKLRRTDLVKLRQTHKRDALAALVGISAARLSQLTKIALEECSA